jgi:hypothetical protein
VTVTATSTADPSKTATAAITITTSAGNEGVLKGQYVFSLSGTDATGFYASAGAFMADGAGSLGGEMDLRDPFTSHLGVYFRGGYAIGIDGRGALRLATSDPTLGVNGVLTMSMVVVNPQHALVTQFDSSATSSGSIDFQVLGSPQGGYAFVLSGIDTTMVGQIPPVVLPLAIGGVLNANSFFSIQDVAEDVNDGGVASVVVSPLVIKITQGPPNPLQISSPASLSAAVTSDPLQLGVNWTASCSTGETGALRSGHAYASSNHTPRALDVTVTGVGIAFSQTPFSPLVTSGQETMSAVVTGDASNAGVDWTVACGSSNCGSVNPTHTVSGDATTTGATTFYTAPATIPQGGSVTLTATSTDDPTTSVTANVVIIPPNTACGSFDPPHTLSGATTTYTAPSAVPTGGTITITASAAGNLSKTDTATVPISTAPSGPIPSPLSPPTYGAFQVPDQLGRGMLALGSRSFIYYLVNSRTLRLMENDSKGVTAGSAFATQGANLTPASLSGNFVFTLAGNSTSPSQFLTTGVLAAGGLFTVDGKGNLTGAKVDVNDAGAVTSYSPVQNVDTQGQIVPPGSYTLNSFGRGSLVLNGPGGTPPGALSQFALYLTADQGILVVDLDFGFVGVGQALAQSGNPISATTFKGNYAIDLQGATGSATSTNVNLVGLVSADGASKLSGTADLGVMTQSMSNTLSPGQPLTGNFTANSDGRFTGNLSAGATYQQNDIFYVVDSSTLLLIEMDTNGQATGTLQLQQLPATPSQ